MGKLAFVINRTSAASEYATAADFQELFASEMVDLFRLAFFLTADAGKAEHCLILTMRECLANRSVFKSWLPVWAWDVLVRNAIRVVMGNRVCPVRKTTQRQALSGMHISAQHALSDSDESVGILHLSDLDRLVYVLCVFERYPIRDCATFLCRSRQEIRDAQNRAKHKVAAFEQEWRRACNGAAQRIQPPPQNEAIGSDRPFGKLVA